MIWTKGKFPGNYPPLIGDEGYDEYWTQARLDQLVIPWVREIDYERLGITTA